MDQEALQGKVKKLAETDGVSDELRLLLGEVSTLEAGEVSQDQVDRLVGQGNRVADLVLGNLNSEEPETTQRAGDGVNHPLPADDDEFVGDDDHAGMRTDGHVTPEEN